MSQLFQVSARDHSAVILMTELARHFESGSCASLQEIATEMQLSEGYLEEIAARLKKAELIIGKQGPGGGYRLTREPKEISLEEILTALTGPIALVDCQATDRPCPVSAKCASKHIWKSVQQSIQTTLQNTRLTDVMPAAK